MWQAIVTISIAIALIFLKSGYVASYLHPDIIVTLRVSGHVLFAVFLIWTILKFNRKKR